MKKIILSWLATKNDFQDGDVSDSSPNYNIHKYFYKHDIHYLFINSEAEFGKQAQKLRAKILKDFKDHRMEICCLDIKDPINVMEIKDRVKYFIISQFNKDLADYELSAFISPGTPAMQVAWYLLKLSGFPQMILLQGRRAEHTRNKIPSFEKVELTEGNTTLSLVAKEIISSNYSEKYPIHYSAIKKVYDDAKKVANSPFVSTLIIGATGTGKENLASFIHNNSSNKERKFLPINCSAFSDSLLESRLFGYEKGAFTGANINKSGLFEEANGGTIFLDEIGDISPYMQQSLLRVIQEKEIIPVGSSKVKKVNFRLICATNKNLIKMCTEEKFRWDLYYRISTVVLNLPDLINWEENDKRELIKYFIHNKAVQFNLPELTLTDNAYCQLIKYSYPGNIRELENIIENLYIFNSGPVAVVTLPSFNNASFSKLTLKSVEKNHIESVLNEYSFNYAKSSKALGIAVNTLKSKIKEYNIYR